MTRGAVPHAWFPAATAAGSLSLLFILVYGTANLYAAQQPDLGALFFEWERRLPLIGWMIVPYMSIDFFFVGAFFIARTEKERNVLSCRIATAILTAGLFFFLIPMRFAFPRSVPNDWTAGVYQFLHGFDAPQNLFPSLHIALRTILADLYGRRFQGPARWASHAWFSLIGLSTLFTHQHHLPDIIAGFVLAGLCFYAVPLSEPDRRVTPNRRVAAYYGFSALSAWLLTAHLPPWGLWFAWPAAALTFTTAAYLGVGPAVYQKEHGRISLAARLLLAPVRLGQWLSLQYYKRATHSWDRITPNLWIGRQLTDKEAREAVQQGVTAVLDLTAEFQEPTTFQRLAYKNIPVLDLTAPTNSQLKEAVDFISAERARGVVYVHCKVGYSRTAAIVGAVLVASGEASDFEDAAKILRAARPDIVIRPEVWGLFAPGDRG